MKWLAFALLTLQAGGCGYRMLVCEKTAYDRFVSLICLTLGVIALVWVWQVQQ